MASFAQPPSSNLAWSTLPLPVIARYRLIIISLSKILRAKKWNSGIFKEKSSSLIFGQRGVALAEVRWLQSRNYTKVVIKEKISFVMLSLDKDSQVEKVKGFVSSRSFTFPVYLPSGYLADQLQVPSIPTTFVITKDGVIDLKEVGMKNYNTTKFKKYLEELAAR